MYVAPVATVDKVLGIIIHMFMFCSMSVLDLPPPKRFGHFNSAYRDHIRPKQLDIWTFGPYSAEFSNDINETICSNRF